MRSPARACGCMSANVAVCSSAEEQLVNQYRPQLYTLEDRKVERMSKPKIAGYYRANEAELARLVEAALRRQHERHFHARKSLFETALQLNQADKAIAQADLLIELCASKGEAEALECKRWIHRTLVNNHVCVALSSRLLTALVVDCNVCGLVIRDGAESGQESVQAGPARRTRPAQRLRRISLAVDLRAAGFGTNEHRCAVATGVCRTADHSPLNIIFLRRSDLLTWAGRLYAEKCQFAESKYYFQRAAANGAEVKEPPPKFELPVQPPMLWSYQVRESEDGGEKASTTAETKPPQRSMPTAHAIIYPATTPDLQRGVLPVRSSQRLS